MSFDGRLAHAALALALALASALTASLARAADATDGPSERARALFQRGVTLAEQERWAEAEQAFAESEALVPRPSTAYDRALALYRLGRLREMLTELDRFVAESDPTRDAADRASVAGLRRSAEAALATLDVTVSPPGAVVAVDGETLAGDSAEHTLRVDPGGHVVLVQHPGYAEERRAVRLAAGERAPLTIELRALPPPSEPKPTSAPRPVPGDAAPSRVGPIAVTTVGAAALLGAVITGVAAGNLDRRIAAQCTGSVCPSALGADQSRMLMLARTSDVLLGVGTSLVGVGIAWWLLTPKSHAGTPITATVATLSIGPMGARFDGAF